MRLEEIRHEHWFTDRIRGHWLVRSLVSSVRWTPPTEQN